jgi:hypothetical protein
MPLSESADAARLAALRAGDERAFAELVDELSPRMLKLARVYLTGRRSPRKRCRRRGSLYSEAWIASRAVRRSRRGFWGSW